VVTLISARARRPRIVAQRRRQAHRCRSTRPGASCAAMRFERLS